jgi:hypothetical protein
MATKSKSKTEADELLDEYDLSKLKGGVRGKYYERAKAGTNLVLLDADVARAFPTPESVNQALRMLVRVAESSRVERREQDQ